MVIDYSLKPPSLGVWLSLLNMLIDFWRKINLFTENTATTINSTSTENITTPQSATEKDTATPHSNQSQDSTSIMDRTSTDIFTTISSKSEMITTFSNLLETTTKTSLEPTRPNKGAKITNFIIWRYLKHLLLTYSVLKRIIFILHLNYEQENALTTIHVFICLENFVVNSMLLITTTQSIEQHKVVKIKPKYLVDINFVMTQVFQIHGSQTWIICFIYIYIYIYNVQLLLQIFVYIVMEAVDMSEDIW